MFFYEKKGKRLIAAVLAAVVAVSVFFMPGIGYESYAGEAEKSEDMLVLENVLKSYEFGVLKPEFGKDSNIAAFLEAGIESKGYEGVGVKVKSSTIPENINLNGNITYFYKDINENQINASNKYVQPELVFELTKGAESVELTKKANIYWDIEKLKSDLKKYILDNVTEDMIKGSNQDFAHVESDMELPAKLEGKSYANLLWETSDSNVLEIKNEGYAWDPKYKAVVKQSAEDKTVTLTLKTSYIFTNTDKENEEIAKLKKDFEVIVKGTGTDASAEMQKQLDDNYTSDKFKDSASGGSVNLLNVTGDITFPTLRKAGVGNSSNYSLTITSEDENIIKINGYKGNVYRPLPGEPSKTVKVTATMAEKNGSLKVQKQFDVTVAPLSQAEIDAEIALMEKVKTAYFEGIRGENTDSSNITKNLHAFKEVSLADDGETLQWAYAVKDCRNKGIKPADIEGYDPMGYNSWRTFRSSRSDIIKDENLLVIQPQYNTEVTIDSELSSIEYERYAEKYKDNEDFKKLSHQKVSATVKVIGTDGEKEEESKVLNKAKVRISLYDGRNKYFVVPFQTVEASAGLAKSYGYTNANIEKHVSDNEVTMFDALVAVHAAVLGISSPEEEGAKESLKDMLTISSSGFLGKVMGEDTNTAPLSLMLNGRMPNDGIYNEAFGSYTGYTVEDSVIKDNDVLSFFFYQDSAYGDYYTWFEKDGKEVQAIEIPAEEMCSLTLRGYLATYYGMSTEEKISQMTTSIGGIQLAVCGEDGMLTDIKDAVTVDGNASVSFSSIGEYILSAKGNGTTPIVAPYLKIKVTEAAQDTEKLNTVKADADALTFNSIKGKNTDSDTVTENLLLTDVGASGKTKITWKSSDKNYLTDEGVVKRPLCEEGDKTVTLTATVSYGTVTETKEISIKILKLPDSDAELDNIIGKLPLTITPSEWNSQSTEKQDKNIIAMVRSLVKAINPTADVSDTCAPSDGQTQIAANGDITYGEKAVRSKPVTFIIKLGSAEKEYIPNVTVAKKEATKEDAFKAEWLDFDIIKGSNTGIDNVISDLSLPKEDNKGYYSELEWSSSNSDIIEISSYASNGKFTAKVNRPSAEQDVKVTLTAKIKPGSYWAYGLAPAGPMPEQAWGEKSFEVTVKAVTAEEQQEAQNFVDEAIKLFTLDELNVRGTDEKLDLMNIAYHFNGVPLNWNYVNKKDGYKAEYKNITVKWSSENPGITKIDSGGTVKRTENDQSGDIVLTLSYNGAEAVKRFPSKVMAFTSKDAENEQTVLKKVADRLTLDVLKGSNEDIANITDNLDLIQSGEYAEQGIAFDKKKKYHFTGGNIAWTSNNPEIISVEWNQLKVTRPEKNTKVTLTATITSPKYSDCPGVTKEEKAIIVGVHGTNDVLMTAEKEEPQKPEEEPQKPDGNKGGSSSSKGGSSSGKKQTGASTEVKENVKNDSKAVTESGNEKLAEQKTQDKANFSDVKATDWFAESVKNLASKGILTGKTENSFAPQDNITRAEFVAVLARMSGQEMTKTTEKFADIKQGAWYGNYVAWAVEAGIVNGTGEETFSPNANITRQDMAVMITRYADYMKSSISGTNEAVSFTDEASVAGYAKEAVTAMQKAGIISGIKAADGQYSFAPKNNATRAEAAKMLYQLI